MTDMENGLVVLGVWDGLQRGASIRDFRGDGTVLHVDCSSVYTNLHVIKLHRTTYMCTCACTHARNTNELYVLNNNI